MAGRFLGRAVLAPKRLHPRLHDRARLHGPHQAGIRSPQREDHRLERRPRREAPGLVEGHRGNAGNRTELPHDCGFRPGVSKLYGMLPAEAGESADGRTAADNQTVRNVYVIGPDKKIKLLISYPMSTGRNFDEVLRVIDSMQLTAKH